MRTKELRANTAWNILKISAAKISVFFYIRVNNFARFLRFRKPARGSPRVYHAFSDMNFKRNAVRFTFLLKGIEFGIIDFVRSVKGRDARKTFLAV